MAAAALLLVALALPAAASSSLEADLKRVLGGPALRGARIGLKIAEMPSGRVLFERRGAELFVPASNQKLFTAHAALSGLGAERRFETRLYRTGPIEAGVLKGDLVLSGRGDPGLSTGALYEIAAALRASGVRRVSGDLVADDSHFFVPEPRYLGGAAAKVYFAPVGALSLNYNTVALMVLGTASGRPAEVLSEAPGDFIRVRSSVQTRGSTSLAASRQAVGGENRFSVSGTVNEGERQRLVRGITEPTSYCARTFAAVLRESGIELGGNVRLGLLDPDAVPLHVHRSAPLFELLYDLNKASNNFLADQVVLHLGLEREGPPATWPKALRALQAHVDALGLGSTRARDGSGLSHDNRTSPADVIALLHLAWTGPLRAQFLATLPIGGRDGTLRNRLGSPDSFGRVRAKTGTISGASTLSGYVFRDDGRTLAFSILINGHSASLGETHLFQDRLLQAMLLAKLDTD
jgi:serine-type D-Ala-D-Ala carboxypeptidase/endopeptidase (penicillin-binding protein 4)